MHCRRCVAVCGSVSHPLTTRLPSPWSVPVLTVPVAGQLLGMSERSAYRAAARGELPTIPVAGDARVPTSALYALLGLPIPPRPAAPMIDGR